MSLATRCTACSTVFRVVQDQLKVSEGWVRCGRCDEVFNALEGLLDLDRDTPPDWSATSIFPPESTLESVPMKTGSAESAQREVQVALEAGVDPAVDKIDAQLTKARESGQDSTPATRINERDRLEFPDAQFDSDMLPDDAIDLRMPASAEAPANERISMPTVRTSTSPGFVQRAQRRARWARPGMRLLLGGVALVLLASLGVQATHQFRDPIAARWPSTAPVLTAWCRAVACTIGAPRRIEDVAVESTALTRASAADAFRLAIVLRNRGAVTVALPSIDLSLTDASGQLVTRRTLAPKDFRLASAPIKPGSESALQLLLAVDGARVAGYTVEVFYP